MPDIVMTTTDSVVTCATDVTNQIKALIECMDNSDLLPDGFSDYDDSSSDEEPDNLHLSVSKKTQDVLESEKRLSQSLGLKSGLYDRSVRPQVYRSVSKPSDTKREHYHQNYKHVKSENNIHLLSNEKVNKDTSPSPRHSHHRHITSHHQNKHLKHPHTHHHGGHHHQHHHHNHHSNKGHNKKSTDDSPENVSSEAEKDDNDTETFDYEALAPIRAGQSDEDVNLPIMTPPPPPEVRNDFTRSSSGFYGRPMSFKFLFAGENIQCPFDYERTDISAKILLSGAVRNTSPVCNCSSSKSNQNSFCGWEVNKKPGRVKTAKRRRNGKHNETSFSRLTQTTGKDPVVFHHYKDTLKYIERYRFYHTVGNVGRPLSRRDYEDKLPGTDPYYSKMKSNLTSVMNSQIFNLAAQMRDDKVGSASSADSLHERPRSDDESNEESGVDLKTCSMRDRGKALNLAPVRECTVPNLAPTDKIDIIQLNQYLNLSTPPMSGDCIDYDMDDGKVKRSYRLPNDHNTYGSNGARRKTRTLRLGSAEFVKPGTSADMTAKWNAEKRPTQKSATNVLSTVPGNLIVGSTVSPIPFQAPRARSGSNVPPYVQYQRDHVANRTHNTLQQISGQKVKACERMTDTPPVGKERGKFSYTHAENNEKMSPPIRTATAVDFRETHIPRDRSRTITLDINHLGIRGQPMRQSEQMVLYKNRRAQSLRS